ncbi:MAG: 2-oxo-4-hydroxy-4-carboxy-5-ureidoimidazoline decarboxylase [Candidatus Pristimantibacillus sp.]
MNLSTINHMTQQQFTEAFGEIFEHSPWVAELAWHDRPFTSLEQLHAAMIKAVKEAAPEKMIALFREHPDLATRIRIGAYSTKEQQGAGLDRLTKEEYELFSETNRLYTEKFGFPFLFAVRGKDKSDILAAMSARIHNSVSIETDEAMLQITFITKFRLEDLLSES